MPFTTNHEETQPLRFTSITTTTTTTRPKASVGPPIAQPHHSRDLLQAPHHHSHPMPLRLPLLAPLSLRPALRQIPPLPHSPFAPHQAPPHLLLGRPLPQNGVVIKLAEDPSFLSPHLEVVGSCNGLLAVRYNVCQFYISNPIIGDFFSLPRPRGDINCSFVWGFGFSPVSSVYKLVMVSIPRKGTEGVVEVRVLSVGSGVWRSIGSSVYPFWIQSSGVCINGVIHWIVGTGKLRLRLEDCFVIYALDVESECFQEFPLPRGTFHTGKVELELGVLQGCLTVNACYKNTISVWVMKEYGVEQSWTKEYVIKNKAKGTFRSHPDIPRVLRVTEEGQVLLFLKHDLQAHNLGDRGLFRLELDRMPLVVHGACVHIPSFVSLKHAIAG
ncbi:PREDICTED: F-box protein At3g07870-like [Fragaria vesca subsp. vesca]|uniref:F-box protein At3g07870-like n=1 Tax=Fragaria vesca subsp. vesca TaxID=101020 RepID=UPI0002C3051F|nr:PREDICTED: F-box protein At3g07870-like [Fragaria vesca subsp. vesca]